MLADIHRLAMRQLRRHLESAGREIAEEDGDLLLDGHRLNVAIEFDGLVEQQGQQIAPLDLRVCLDGDSDDRFRVGVLGVGRDVNSALESAVSEWHLLAAAPLLAALGAAEGTRRRNTAPTQLAGWQFYPGRAAVRGALPAGLQENGGLQRSLLLALRDEVSSWPDSVSDQLRSIFIMVSTAEGLSVQAAVDGLVSESLAARLAELPWPQDAGSPYFFKQLFVLKRQS